MKKALTGVISIIPIAMLIGIIISFALSSSSGVNEAAKTLTIVFICGFIISWIIGYIVFVPDVFNLKSGKEKALWIFLVLILSALVFPIYWFKFYRRKK